MLIINADDWGKNEKTTDNILKCFKKGRISSTSAMMFMEDSKRAADIALFENISVGLHINFTEKFADKKPSEKLFDAQEKIIKYLKKNKFAQLIYNPFLKKEFNFVYQAQYNEFINIYKKEPSHINGHHHMHLCTNMIIGKVIPKKSKVRLSFSFKAGQKGLINRIYRMLVNKWLKNNYVVSDYFYSIAPIEKTQRLKDIIRKSLTHNVELMVHPDEQREYEYLLSDDFMKIISKTDMLTFNELEKK